ncbi:MarR family winged helix-turn-helix transcriptional regulator [Streptomyces sp. H39-C1]|uniref:MarR family winged helix-turn-helix transcriptional regulator n=1 Tax=Streptomyces sp. H39-C1 TaxID=3004355 RepID=UPI0022AF0355|nr:MarR family transcriptional regulator [Streptomyces sp. H39-C1]MCZ4103747.1 MarR family transcriptional regulator [Streptomyces sp. H39-C1]
MVMIEACEGVNLTALSEALSSRPSGVSRLCDGLEAAGLLERGASTTSGREVELRLIASGQSLTDIRDFRRREVTTVLRTMPTAQLVALIERLEALPSAARSHTNTAPLKQEPSANTA